MNGNGRQAIDRRHWFSFLYSARCFQVVLFSLAPEVTLCWSDVKIETEVFITGLLLANILSLVCKKDQIK